MNGRDVARKIKESESNNNGKTLLVALTGYDWEESDSQAEEKCFDFYLTKPIKLETLEEIINIV